MRGYKLIAPGLYHGAPRRLQKDGKELFKPNNEEEGSQVRPGSLRGVIKMPAYKGLVSERQLDDLVTFIMTITELQRPAPPEAEKGRRIAFRLGCFACHGPGGRGGTSNPGSFAGYIPPWDGEHFKEVVKNEDELRQWILEGKIDRFEANPLARYFTHGQIIQMPAYRNILKDGELEAIIVYIRWLRDEKKDFAQYWVEASVPPLASIVERGKWLYYQTGCVACHGLEGQSGIPNRNAAGGFVPALNDLAERMQLFEKEDVEAIVAIFERGMSLEDPSISPPVLYFDDVISQYLETRNIILQGSHSRKRDKEGPPPPLVMPGWNFRLNADDSPPSRADIDALIAYLLTLQTFEEEE